ncbi:hypothetical protein KEM54_005998 [Ascosphaera aggregata]|nr:hypothetical protein KEM54_005998 [Ascosphaera aggregata]
MSKAIGLRNAAGRRLDKIQRHPYASPPQTQSALPLRSISQSSGVLHQEKDAKSPHASPTLSSYNSYNSLNQTDGPSPPTSTSILSPISSDLNVHRSNPPYIHHTATATESTYYNSHPSAYPVTATPPYSSAEQSEMMATTQLHRQSYPPMYTPAQPQGHIAVSSPATHDYHSRGIYAQPPPQGMYSTYGQIAQPMGPYASHPSSSPQLHSPTMLMSHAQAPAGCTMGPPPPPHVLSPRSKFASQRPGMGSIDSHTTPAPSTNMPKGGSATPTGSTGAAPGPIPATTPILVCTDESGVQWISFEYSRDRAKIKYTIRCDVENVNINSLSTEFKTENCVYPRAFCKPDEYKGNRLNYENECNTVGWALAELNENLRGKRGLIQRAVDSWRNSNKDPRLRSRRVRRLAKMQHRKGSHPSLASGQRHHHHLAAGGQGYTMPHGLVAGNRVSASGLQLVSHHSQPAMGATVASPHHGCGDGVGVQGMFGHHV